MEIKKAQQLPASKPAETPTVTSSSIAEFLSEVKAEVKRINWTSPEELKVYTKMVVATTFVLGLGIYIVDLLIQNFLAGLETLLRLIG